MLSFNTPKPYSFEVEGKAYTLPALTLDLIDDFTSVLEAPSAEQGKRMLTVLEKHSDKRTFAVIRTRIPIKKEDDNPSIEDLFLDWGGMRKSAVTPGESEGSPEL